MDLRSTIIGTILLSTFIVPIIRMNRNRKKSEGKSMESLINIANKHNCTISKHEICNDLVIGIDETKNVVFFNKIVDDNELKQVINLSEIKSCKVINTSRTIKSKNDTYKVVDRLELSLVPTAKNKSDIKVEFYNAETRGQLNGELQSIEKWSKLIADRLQHTNA